MFDKVILENNFSSKTYQFRNKKETREFKRLRFYGSNNLSPKLTKNQFHRNTHVTVKGTLNYALNGVLNILGGS